MSLKDVITQLEPGLFKKVTGLNVKDFELLCSLGVFNASLMNSAIFSFKHYEDSSLSYTGIDKHAGKDVGGWDTVIKREEYEKMFYNQQATMAAPKQEEPEEEPEPIVITKPAAPKIEKTKTTFVTEQYGTKKPVAAPKPTAVISPAKPAYGAAPSKDHVDVSWVEEGVTVMHGKFGPGKVTKIDKPGKHIHVKFALGKKNFIFPDAFDMGFLKKE